MFIIDFFKYNDCEGSTKLISDYFGINHNMIFEELSPYLKKEYNLANFIEKFNLNLEHAYQRETYITCRHATTIYDGLNYLRKYGLVNLKIMLEEETPLSKFLKENAISIDVDRKILVYNGEEHKILSREERCENCIFEEYQCTSFLDSNLPDYKSCEYREELNVLHSKLYDDKCEIEAFIDGKISDIYDYESVRYSPEILITIENIIWYYDKTKSDLKNKWKNIDNNKYYILEFNVDINNFEYVSSKEKYGSYLDIYDIAEKFEYDEYDFEEGNISSQFYKNLFILKRLVDNFIWGNDVRYVQILPTTIIEGKSIKIIREHDVMNRAPEEFK